MKKILISLFSLISCLLILVSCKSKDESKVFTPPQYHYDGLLLYVYTDREYPEPNLYENLLYSVTNVEENVTITLSKDKRYIFEIRICELDSKDFLTNDSNIAIYNSDYANSITTIYESALLELIDYGYIGDFGDNPWFGEWGAYYLKNISDIEETTIGFYHYPNLIKVNLKFE